MDFQSPLPGILCGPKAGMVLENLLVLYPLIKISLISRIAVDRVHFKEQGKEVEGDIEYQ